MRWLGQTPSLGSWPIRVGEQVASRRYDTFVTFFLAVFGLLLVAANAFLPGTYITYALQDHWHFLDGAYRVHVGQVPHIDFPAPIGLLTYVLPALALDWGLPLSRAMPVATALVTALFLPVTVYACATRLRPAISLPVGVFLLLLTSAPVIVGSEPINITTAMSYNRFCWVAFSLTLLLYLPPHRDCRRTRIADGLALAVLFLFQFYVKSSYAACAAVTIAIICLCRRGGLGIAAVAALATAAVALGVELHWPGVHRAYLADFEFIISVTAGVRLSVGHFFWQILRSLPELLIAIMAIGVGLYLNALRLVDVVVLLFAVASSAALIQQNSQPQGLPSLVIVVGIIAELTMRRRQEAVPRGQTGGVFLLLASLVILVAPPALNYAVALWWQFTRLEANVAPGQALPASLAGLVVEDWGVQRMILRRPDLRHPPIDYDLLRQYRPPAQPLYQAEYLQTILDGLALLHEQGGERCAIVTLDFANPFPLALGNEPPRHIPLSNVVDRTFSAKVFLPAEVWFADDPIVMIPKRSVARVTADALQAVYRSTLDQRYEPVAENATWTLMAPKGRPRTAVSLCPDAGNAGTRAH